MSDRGVTRRPIQPLVAASAMRTLVGDPDDTAQVFRIIRALSGDSFERLYQRVLADPGGGRVLAERRAILSTLTNRDRLRQLADGTLGREYLRFVEHERITAEGLVDVSGEDDDEGHFLDERAKVLSRRLRDTHDLWHVVTGYQRDLFGEAALLAFTYAQTRNGGIGFIVMIALLKQWQEGHREAMRLTWGAWRRGRRAAFLPAADWEGLLAMPLDQVRRELRVTDLPTYTPMFSAAAPAH